ncbi:MAG: CAP domain-containing protein, partial [Chloroflexota bacterium]
MLFAQWGSALAAAPPAAPVSPSEQDVLANVNAARRRHGLAPVVLSAGLDQVASWRSADMVAHKYFSHTFPGCNPEEGRWSSLRKAPCNFLGILDSQHVGYRWAGEVLEWNLFLTQFSPRQTDSMAVNDLLHSPLHRDIIL